MKGRTTVGRGGESLPERGESEESQPWKGQVQETLLESGCV